MKSRREADPLVSVIIPMFNAEKTIEDCILSVFSQSYGCYEIIIVDDGSMDNSAVIVKKLMKHRKGKAVRYYYKKNGGVSSARNEGIRKAKGEFIALLDSDDEWLPEKLERQVSLLKKRPGIDFVGCGRNGEGIKYLFKKVRGISRVTVKDLVFKMNPQSSTAVFRKSALSEVGLYDESMKYAEDGNFWIRFCAVKNFFVTSENLVITGKGKPDFGYKGLSAKLWLMEKGELKNLMTALESGYIHILIFAAALFLSIVKYIRRIIIVKIRTLYGVNHDL